VVLPEKNEMAGYTIRIDTGRRMGFFVSFYPGSTWATAKTEAPRSYPEDTQNGSASGTTARASPSPYETSISNLYVSVLAEVAALKTFLYSIFFIFSLLFSVMGIGLRYTERMAGVEKRRKEAEKEKIKAELAYLKMQISPHFFFNTLNNIYALIEASPKDGQQAVHQLSRMMRYMIYESERGNVLLQQEVDFLKNYLELMRLRLTGKTNVVVHLPDELPQIEVPPLLFLPFVENAFKHGVSNAHPAAISIRMSVGTDEICFKCTNTIQHYHIDVATLYPDQGIGLENVRKRLQLLLPDRHELVISHQEFQHTVLLRILLK
jgi:two-component system, LytTR family, sensor kinase